MRIHETDSTAQINYIINDLGRELNLKEVNSELAAMTTEERILWAVKTFGTRAVLLSSMQKSDSVMMHFFYRLGLANEIILVDTGYHFRETLQLRDIFMLQYRLNVVTLYPKQTVEQQEKATRCKLYQSIEGQTQCCRFRKIMPFISHIKDSGHKLVMAGVRRSEGDKRAEVNFAVKDKRFDGYTFHPLLDWTDKDIEQYLTSNNVPVHALHRQNYPSIGCECCTTPVDPGEYRRAGRWRHLRETDTSAKYCGILYMDGAGI